MNTPEVRMNKDRFNFNTLLLAILLGLGGWGLVSINAAASAQASMAAKLDAYKEQQSRVDTDMRDYRLRLAAIELEVARIKGRLP
jgi:hypothetical protein